MGLFYMNSFNRAFVGGLLGEVFEFGRDLIDKDRGYGIAHGINFRTGANTKAAGGAGIVNCNFHKTSHL